MKRIIFILLMLGLVPCSYAGQSTILEAEGIGCTSLDASRRQAEKTALEDAERDAMERAGIHIKASTLVKDAEVQSDLIQSFSHASFRLIRELEKEWQKSGEMDSCLHLRIEAEVIPDPVIMKKVEKKTVDDPTAPLNVQIWTEKNIYKKGELVSIYLKGNKPFFGRIVYRDASNHLIQLLPNPHRKDHYFNGGAMYKIPSGNDRFELEVTPPFGNEQITVYASTAPAGDLGLKDAGDVYQITTAPNDLSIKTRGIAIHKLASGGSGKNSETAEFSENQVKITTQP